MIINIEIRKGKTEIVKKDFSLFCIRILKSRLPTGRLNLPSELKRI